MKEFKLLWPTARLSAREQNTKNTKNSLIAFDFSHNFYKVNPICNQQTNFTVLQAEVCSQCLIPLWFIPFVTVEFKLSLITSSNNSVNFLLKKCTVNTDVQKYSSICKLWSYSAFILNTSLYHNTFHSIFLKNLSRKTKTWLNLLFFEGQATRHHSHHIQHHLEKCVV